MLKIPQYSRKVVKKMEKTGKCKALCFSRKCNKYLIFFFFKWRNNSAKITSFHSKTWVKMWQIPSKLLNDHFTNVTVQNAIKTKFVNNYRTYARMKNKMIKTQHNSLFTLTKRWFGDSILKIKQGSLKKTKLNFQLLLQLKISSPHFFHYD